MFSCRTNNAVWGGALVRLNVLGIKESKNMLPDTQLFRASILVGGGSAINGGYPI